MLAINQYLHRHLLSSCDELCFVLDATREEKCVFKSFLTKNVYSNIDI